MNNSYIKERIKLTALYFGIILFIVVVFTIIVTHTQNQQFKRFEPWQEVLRKEQKALEYGGDMPGIPRKGPTVEEIEYVDAIIKEIKEQNLRAILLFDSLILIAASILSYYLAGETLRPILHTLEKQKRFISDASHELKTPLTNIITEAEVLNRSSKTTIVEYKEFTANVVDDANRLNELVMFLLDSARLDNHTLQAHKNTENLSEIVEDTARKFRERAKKKDIIIEVTSEPESIEANTDKSILIRLLSIIIDNAIKYNTKDGKIFIKTTRDQNKQIKIEIQDTGVGIEEKDISKIFDRFYRVSEDRNEKGFGLGLPIAKQLATLLNIDISIKSKVNEGTTFTLVLK